MSRRSHYELLEARARRAIETAPHDAHNHHRLAKLLTTLGRLDEAAVAFRQAVALAPTDGALTLSLAEALLARNAGSEVIELLRSSSDGASDDHADGRADGSAGGDGDVAARSRVARFRIEGHAWETLGDWARAVQCYDRAIAAGPDDPAAHCDRAGALAQLGDMPSAIAVFAGAVARWPGSVRAGKGLALALLHTGDSAKAVEVLREGLRLRRGPGSVAEDPLSVTASRLRHDIDQMRYLGASGGWPAHLPPVDTSIERYTTVLNELPRAAEGLGLAVVLTDSQRALIADIYDRALHVFDTPALAGGALRSSLDSRELAAQWADRSLVVIDQLLTAAALAALRRFCLESTIWFTHDYEDGYIGAFVADGFSCGLLFQIVAELRCLMPDVLAAHPLREIWAFKYDSRRSGTRLHADRAAVNVNLWLTPDAANLDPDSGGLVVYGGRAPVDWGFDAYNGDPERGRALLEASGATTTAIPYRENRAVLFDSSFFHETAPYAFRPEYDNRRINVTMLFGDRGR